MSQLLCCYLQVVEHYFSQFAKLDTSLKIGFERSEITLNIPEDGRTTDEGWKITPMTYPVVRLQWNPSIANTIWTKKFVLYSEMSLTQALLVSFW